jgi:hypothetical protein
MNCPKCHSPKPMMPGKAMRSTTDGPLRLPPPKGG